MELALVQKVGGKSVGINLGRSLGVGEDVDLAVGLLERLRDAKRLQKPAPRKDIAHVRVDRMPQPNRIRRRRLVDSATVDAHKPPVDKHRRRSLIRRVV